MDSQKKQELYEEYMAEISPMAAAIGQRVPYHLEYLRVHGHIEPIPPAGDRKTGGEESCLGG